MSHLQKSKLAIAILATLTSAARAEAASAAPENELTTVVVIGEKYQRPLEKTLSSVAVTTEEDLRNNADADLHDVFLRTPGVFATEGNNTFSIRGIPFDGLGSGSSDVVSVYVDDTLQSRRSMSFAPASMWDIQQVEIYRGTQSLIQGRNALAGSIIIKSNDPTFEREGAVRINAGNYGERGASAAVSGGLVDGVVAGRLALDYQENDGYIDNTYLDREANPTSDITLRGKLLIQPRTDLDVLLTLLHSRNEMGNQSVAKDPDSGQVSFYEIATNVDALDKVDKDTLNARVDYRINNHWTFTSISAANRSDYEGVIDFGQDVSEDDALATDDVDDFLSQELRLAYNGDAALTGLFGAYFFESDKDRYDSLAAFEFERWTDVDISSAAVFGEINWLFSPRWTATTGLRYDREKYVNETLEGTDASPSLRSTVDAWLPKIGLSYSIDEHQTLGLVAQRGYRAGGASFNFATLELVEFDPEYTNNLELAYRSLWLEQRLRLNLNLYRIEWEDQQVSVLTDPANDNSGQIENAGESRLKGGEVTVAFLLTPAVELYAGAAYNDAEYQDFVTDTQDFSGYQFERAPLVSVSAGTTLRPYDGWTFNLSVVRLGETHSQYLTDPDAADPKRVSEVLKADAYTLWNASASYQTGDWTFSAYGKNLSDKQYLTNHQEGNTSDVGAPRTFGAEARFEF